MPYGAVFALAAAMAFAATLVVRSCARRAGVVDRPDGFRKTQEQGVPLLGGIGVFVAFCGSILIVRALAQTPQLTDFMARRDVRLVFAGGAVVMLLGVLDDVWGFRARWRIFGMLLVSIGMYAAGFRITGVSNPFGPAIQLGWLAPVVTVFWFLGCMNAINLIDGLDGLAAGVAFFASGSVLLAGMAFGNAPASLMAAALAGACIGFLVLNFHPASIYLGDCGSLLLGFLLACVGLRGAQKSQMVVALLIPLIALGLPIMDTSLAILRRWLKAVPFFCSDRQHIHHKLLEMGLSYRTAVLVMYGACLILAEIALLMTATNSRQAAALLLVLGLLTYLAVRTIGRHEYAMLKEKVGGYVGRRHRRIEVRGAANVASASMRNARSVQDLWTALTGAAEAMGLDGMDLALADIPSGGDGDRNETGDRARGGHHDRNARHFHWRNGPNGQARDDILWTAVFPMQVNGSWLGRLWVHKATNGRPLEGDVPDTLELLTKAVALNTYRLDHAESPGTDAQPDPMAIH